MWHIFRLEGDRHTGVISGVFIGVVIDPSDVKVQVKRGVILGQTVLEI